MANNLSNYLKGINYEKVGKYEEAFNIFQNTVKNTVNLSKSKFFRGKHYSALAVRHQISG